MLGQAEKLPVKRKERVTIKELAVEDRLCLVLRNKGGKDQRREGAFGAGPAPALIGIACQPEIPIAAREPSEGVLDPGKAASDPQLRERAQDRENRRRAGWASFSAALISVSKCEDFEYW